MTARRPRLLLAVALVLVTAIAVPLAVVLSRDDDTAVPSCSGKSSFELDCQRRRHAALVRTAGVSAAFGELKRNSRREGFLRTACHPITHEIGHAAVDRYRDLAEAFARGDSFCSAGYYHGATERLIETTSRAQIVRRANRLCAELGADRRHGIFHRNCAHGLGHGFMLVHTYELRDSLGTCDELRDSWERRSCYGGAFMENVMTLGTKRTRSRYLRPDRPLYPCDVLERRYRSMCYQKQTGYAAYVLGDDFAAVFELCRRVEKAFRPACHEGLGTNVAVHNLKRVFEDRQRTGRTAGTCMLGRDVPTRASCVKGAVRAIINYDHDVARAKALCAAVRSAMRGACLRVVEDKRTWPE